MRRNLTELEQRLTELLKKDSRKSMSEIAEELGVSRITAKKTMDSLLESGKIKAFTVRLDMDDTDLAIVHLANHESVPEDMILEDFQMIDGTHIMVIYYEDLVKLNNVRILDVRIARRRVVNEGTGRVEHLHCDLCNSEIKITPIRVQVNKKVFYACCPTCERELKKRYQSLSA